MRFKTVKVALCSMLVGVSGAQALASPAMASTDAPGWEVGSHSYPTNLPPGGSGVMAIDIYNIGAAASNSGATVTDTLPEGLVGVSSGGWHCSETTPVVCSRQLGGFSVGTREEEPLEVNVAPGASEGTFPNEITVAGGGAPNPASASSQITISSAPASFGFSNAAAWLANADGTLDTQAGSHPYGLTLNFELNAERDTSPVHGEEVRNLAVRLPPGFVGNPTAFPRCLREQFDNEECSAASQVGVAKAGVSGAGAPVTLTLPIYNLVPSTGMPAELGFTLLGIHAFIETVVRTGGDDGITERVDDVPQRTVVTSSVTIWGVPGEPSHDAQREGVNCRTGTGCPSSTGKAPFLTLPTFCAGPQTFLLSADTWGDSATEARYEVNPRDASGAPAGFIGCDHLGFTPSVSVAPDTGDADTPAALTASVTSPQEGLLNGEGLASSDIQNTTVTLPPNFVINPGQAAGLQACGPGEDGLTTEAEKANGEEDSGPAHCPAASKAGTVSITTPLLPRVLEGKVYVLQSNPPEIKLLATAEGEGVFLKLLGEVHLCESAGQVIAGKTCQAPGQVMATFEQTPDLPFTTFKLSFNGGAQAALDTPTQCGTYTTSSDFTPWSSPFVPDAFPTAAFAITAGPGGGPCPPGPLPFAPTMTAGSTTDQAGAFTNFSLLLQRGDGQQRIEKLQFKEPAGLAGLIAGVPLCQEPQAGQGTCPAASHIGHAVVAAGPGPYPLVLPQPGAPELPIYLTGPYKGAPFGLSIVTPVIAGPFNLGTVVTRAKIEVDPRTAQITITTDALPQIVAGVPTDLRSINSIIDRPRFLFNPTNCNAQEFTGTAWGTPPAGADGPGAAAAISSNFGIGSCKELAFTPKFSASTSGKTSKTNGASLTVHVAQKPGEANIHKVDLQLPLGLPSRLTTLQKACTEVQFVTNPAGCPTGSVIGTAKVVTPVLNAPLTGPAYLVSHGGAAFPDVEFVLQGEGVTIVLDGKTDIKKGITYSRFETVPDAPISSFETVLPEGPHSVLAAYVPANANGSFCGLSLPMPTTIEGQNGAQIKQSTMVAVTGCKPAINIVTKKRSSGKVLLTLRSTVAGTLTITGTGVKKTKLTVAVGEHQVNIALTSAGRRRRTIKLRIVLRSGKATLSKVV